MNGQQLKEKREALGLTIAEVSCRLGPTVQLIAAWENEGTPKWLDQMLEWAFERIKHDLISDGKSIALSPDVQEITEEVDLFLKSSRQKLERQPV